MKGAEIACLASSSALSFPAMPMWLGIQFKVTGGCVAAIMLVWSRAGLNFPLVEELAWMNGNQCK